MPQVAWQGLDRELASSLGVTRREDEVLGSVIARLSNAEIAAKLYISERTVESHVSSLLRKLDARDRSELIERARALTADTARRDTTDLDGPPPGRVRSGWLPPVTGSLIARDELIVEVADQIVAGVVVTLVGVGGVGKTRLAAAVAGRIGPDHGEAVVWLDLTTLSDPGAIVYELAGLLGVRAFPGGALVDTVATAIGDRDQVVVFDNCEHVLDPSRALIHALLDRCRGLAVLATSRERLGLASERLVPVGPLTHAGVDSPAVDVLVDRLGVPRSALDGAELDALTGIARRLDGIPLALELAAARCRQLGIVEVGRRLPGQLGRLSDPGREARHQTLDATIDWSYGLLAPVEQALLRSLSVFSGWFDLDAVESVAGDDVDVEAVVASLFDKSLLERVGRRFRLLEITRDFARSRLSQAGDRDAVEAEHTRHVRLRVLEIYEGLEGRDEAMWVEQLDALWPDVRAVARRLLDDDDADAVIDLVTHLALEAFYRRPEAFTWIVEAAGRWGDRPGPHRRELLGAACIVASHQTDVPEAIRLATIALADDTNPGNSELDVLADGAAVGTFTFAGRHEEALTICRRAVARLSTGSDRPVLARMYAHLANVLANSGVGADSDELARAVQKSITIAHATGNPTTIAYAYFIAFATGATGPARAPEAVELARAYASEVDNRWLRTLIATVIALRGGAPSDEAALAMAFDAAEDLHRTGWSTLAWFAMWDVIAGLFDLGRTEAAAMVLGGCESSHVSPMAGQHVPAELEDESSTTAPYRHLGSQLRFDDLLAIVAGRRQLPLLPSYSRRRSEPG